MLGHLDGGEVYCQKYAEEHKRKFKNNQVFRLLASRNQELEPVRALILENTVLLLLNTEYSLLLHNDGMVVMLTVLPKKTALAVKTKDGKPGEGMD